MENKFIIVQYDLATIIAKTQEEIDKTKSIIDEAETQRKEKNND